MLHEDSEKLSYNTLIINNRSLSPVEALTRGAVEIYRLAPLPHVDKSMADRWRTAKFAVPRDWLPVLRPPRE